MENIANRLIKFQQSVSHEYGGRNKFEALIGKSSGYLSGMQRKINDQLGIKRESTFYSWKHTGAVELFNLTKDPYVVMRQCRHTDIKMTMVYLRSLGCGVNEQVRQW